MSGATGKVSQLEKVMSLLATLLKELEALPSEGTARMCSDLTQGLSTVMGSIARATHEVCGQTDHQASNA